MAKKQSAGLLLYRSTAAGEIEVMVIHMGGPFWTRKDARAWSIPKGGYAEPEDPLSAARREFEEEIGRPAPAGDPIDLGSVKQSGGKVVQVWALEGDMDVSEIESNTFELEWPRGSGRVMEYPEADRAEWFDLETAAEKLVKGQVAFLDRLAELLERDR